MLLAKVFKCSQTVSSIIPTTRMVVQLRRSNLKEFLQKHAKQFCERKTVRFPSRLLLGGTVVFKADLSVTEVASASSSPAPASPLAERQSDGVSVLLLWLLQSGRLLVHCVRTLLVFTPLLLSCPLLLLPGSLRPSSLLLDLLGSEESSHWLIHKRQRGGLFCLILIKVQFTGSNCLDKRIFH